MTYIDDIRVDGKPLDQVLDTLLAHHLGRPRLLRSRLALLAFLLNAFRKGHHGHIADAARALSLIPEPVKTRLDIPGVPLQHTYRRLEAWLTAVVNALTDNTNVDATAAPLLGQTPLNVFTVCQLITRSPLSEQYRTWPSAAIDGTDVPTFGNLHVAHDRLPLDGDAIYDADGGPFGGEAGQPSWAVPASQYTHGGARIFGVGPDDRLVLTLDVEARAGYRTATAKRPAGMYVGYEATTAVAMRRIKYTDGATMIVFGPVPKPVFLGFNLTPAGTHRGEASLALVNYLQQYDLTEVAADRGITLPRGYLQELRRWRIESVHTLTELQRHPRPGPPGSLFIDQTLLTASAPSHLLKCLPLPPRHAKAAARAQSEAQFNERALYRWRLRAGPNHAGCIRLSCPVCTAHTLRCRAVPASLRQPAHHPFVVLPTGRTRCCDTKTVSFGPNDYPLWMGKVVPFTTAHNLSYGRRNAAETGNSLLHGDFVDLNETWAEVFGTPKRALLLAFTLAGINHRLLSQAD